MTFPTASPQITYAFTAGTDGTATKKQATFYTLTSATTAGQDPKSWQLQGATDGTHWTTLDTRTSQSFTDRLQTRPFEIAQPGSYSSYRLVVTASTGSSTSLSELELLAPSTSPGTP